MNDQDEKASDDIPLPCWVAVLRERMEELEKSGKLEVSHHSDGEGAKNRP